MTLTISEMTFNNIKILIERINHSPAGWFHKGTSLAGTALSTTAMMPLYNAAILRLLRLAGQWRWGQSHFHLQAPKQDHANR